mgnify:CR=1 FL=1
MDRCGIVSPRVLLLFFLSVPLVSHGFAPYPWPKVLYEDQFEYADLSRWRRIETAGGGAVVLDQTRRHSGRHAARCSIPKTEQARHAFLRCQTTHAPRRQEGSAVYVRAYFLFGEDVDTGTGEVPFLGLFRFKPAPDGAPEPDMVRLCLRKTAGKNVVAVAGSDEAGATDVVCGVWHCVEVKAVSVDGKCEVEISLNGKKEVFCRRAPLPASPDGFSFGFLDDSPGAGTILVDDVVVSDSPIGPDDCSVKLAHPCFIPRSAAPVVAILTGDRPTDRLTATFTGSGGMRRTVFRKEGPPGGRVDFTVDLSGLPAATYTLTVRLSDREEKTRAEASYTYEKPFDGVPEFSIDADNNILWNGKKFFPVTSFGLRRTSLSEWQNRRLCNLFYGMEWASDLPGVPGYRRLLDAARDAGGKMVGPAHDSRFDRPPDRKQWTTEAVEEYLRELKGHPAVAWWMWREEPVNWKYTPESQKQWWDAVKRLDPSRMVEILDMGNCYQIGLLKAQQVYLTWPFLAGDIYSWDIYPIENETAQAFADYAEVADRACRWNMNLVPVIANVATADVTPGRRGGTPTPQEIRFVCWLSIVHGAKGIHWYPYQGVVPPENYEAMARFVEETTVLTGAILGRQLPEFVSKKELSGGRVDTMATMDEKGDLWLFAVNLTRKPETVAFTFHPDDAGVVLPQGSVVRVFGEPRTLSLDGSRSFTDEFDGIGVRIYRIPARR